MSNLERNYSPKHVLQQNKSDHKVVTSKKLCKTYVSITCVTLFLKDSTLTSLRLKVNMKCLPQTFTTCLFRFIT